MTLEQTPASQDVSEISGETNGNLEIFSANATTHPIPAAVNPNRTTAMVRPRQLRTEELTNDQPTNIVGVASWGSDHVQQLSGEESDQDPYFMDVTFWKQRKL